MFEEIIAMVMTVPVGDRSLPVQRRIDDEDMEIDDVVSDSLDGTVEPYLPRTDAMERSRIWYRTNDMKAELDKDIRTLIEAAPGGTQVWVEWDYGLMNVVIGIARCTHIHSTTVMAADTRFASFGAEIPGDDLFGADQRSLWEQLCYRMTFLNTRTNIVRTERVMSTVLKAIHCTDDDVPIGVMAILPRFEDHGEMWRNIDRSKLCHVVMDIPTGPYGLYHAQDRKEEKELLSPVPMAFVLFQNDAARRAWPVDVHKLTTEMRRWWSQWQTRQRRMTTKDCGRRSATETYARRIAADEVSLKRMRGGPLRICLLIDR
jgi:hypothetical protein